MGAGKSSVRRTFNTDSHRGHSIACGRSSVRIARGVLGCDRYSGCYAINDRRNCIDFDCRYGAGGSGRRPCGKLFPGKSFGVRRGCVCAGTLVRCISDGEKRVSQCRRHVRHYRAYSAFTRCMDHCTSPLLRSLGWNPGRFGGRGRLAGASTRIRKTKRPIIRACVSARAAIKNELGRLF